MTFDLLWDEAQRYRCKGVQIIPSRGESTVLSKEAEGQGLGDMTHTEIGVWYCIAAVDIFKVWKSIGETNEQDIYSSK